MGRQIKKTIIKYETSGVNDSVKNASVNGQKVQQNRDQVSLQRSRNENQQERQRSRQKIVSQVVKQQQPQIQDNKNEVTVDVNSRKARLQAMKKARQQKEKLQAEQKINSFSLQKENQNNGLVVPDIKIVIVNNNNNGPNSQLLKRENNLQQEQKKQTCSQQQNDKISPKFTPNQNQHKVKIEEQVIQQNQINKQQDKNQPDSSQEEEQKEEQRVLHKPVFLSKQDRSQFHEDQQQQKKREEQRKRKNLRYTTKMLLEQTIKKDQQQQDNSQEQIDNNDEEDQTNLPDDSDEKNEELQYQLWKIRQLKRIRRDRELRQKHVLEKAEIDRRRQMNNEQILLQNRLLGSDSTDQQTQTKYVFMQKYYHKGAFYQDTTDPIFQRDYNLPTPMQMQDKSGLPSILQKRKGNFGKRGQSKYTHLTAEDTTDTNPLTRADQSLLNNWKKKMAGYKK